MEEDSKKTKTEIDLADSQNEAAGRNTSKIERFSNNPDGNMDSPNSEKKKRQEFFDRLSWLLANDPTYAKLYYELEAVIEDTEKAIRKAYERIEQRIEETDGQLRQMQESASTLPDGTKVFRSKNGEDAYTEDGRKLSVDEMSQVLWQSNAPTWEDYQQVKEDQQQALEDKAAVEHYDIEVVQATKEKMKTGEMSHKDLGKALEDIKAEMPRAVTEVMNPLNEQEKASVELSILEPVSLENAPDMKTHFETVRVDVPDLSAEAVPELKPKP